MKKLKWSPWVALKTLDLTTIPPTSGVYQMRWAASGKPKPINRANGVDESGMLYIGKTMNLKKRLKALYRGIVEERLTHTAAYTYMFDEFDKKFKPKELEVQWGEVPKDEIDDHEYVLMGEYIKAYLDNPPLNISRGRK